MSVPQSPGEFEFEVLVTDGQSPPGNARKSFTLTINGSFASPAEPDPCSAYPLFCLSLNWHRPSGAITYGDFEGDGDVDEKDLLKLIQTLRD